MESWNWIYFKLPRYLFWRYTISQWSIHFKGGSIRYNICNSNRNTDFAFGGQLPGPPQRLATNAWPVLSYLLYFAGCTTWTQSRYTLQLRLIWLTLRAEWSLMAQLVWSVTSATEPASLTMNTFMDCETWRPVSTAVFISSQLWEEENCCQCWKVTCKIFFVVNWIKFLLRLLKDRFHL